MSIKLSKHTKNRVVLFGRNIRLIRNRWDMTQVEFGNIFDISRGAINTYEMSKAEPKIWVIIELQLMTGINTHDIYYSRLTKEMIPSSPLTDTDQAPPIMMSTSEPNENYGPVSREEFRILQEKVDLIIQQLNKYI